MSYPSMGFGCGRQEPSVKMSRRQKLFVTGIATGVAAVGVPLCFLIPPADASAQHAPAPRPAVTRPADDTIMVPGLLGGVPF